MPKLKQAKKRTRRKADDTTVVVAECTWATARSLNFMMNRLVDQRPDLNEITALGEVIDLARSAMRQREKEEKKKAREATS
jgi:hypothetical protein